MATLDELRDRIADKASKDWEKLSRCIILDDLQQQIEKTAFLVQARHSQSAETLASFVIELRSLLTTEELDSSLQAITKPDEREFIVEFLGMGEGEMVAEIACWISEFNDSLTTLSNLVQTWAKFATHVQPSSHRIPVQSGDTLDSLNCLESVDVPKSTGTVPSGDSIESHEIDKESIAISMIVKDGGLTVNDIAKRLDVHRTTVYKWPNFMPIFRGIGEQYKQGKAPPRGRIENGQVEVFDE